MLGFVPGQHRGRPGLGPAATIAMLLPLTYKMDPAGGIIMMAGIYYDAKYGGSTTSILLNIPDLPQMRGILGTPGMPAEAVRIRGDVLQSHQDADLAEIPKRQPARRRVRQGSRAHGLSQQVRGPASRDIERVRGEVVR
jgi:hypothetical protein